MEIGILPPKMKTTISVPEMRRLLGLGKTESYWLVKKHVFKSITVNGQIRVDIKSFEEWYAGQFHYKKTTGEPPGSRWNETVISLEETATKIGVCVSTIYEYINKGKLKAINISNKLWVYRESLEKWQSMRDAGGE